MIEVTRACGIKCERCWHYEADVGQHSEHPDLCGRCTGAEQTRSPAGLNQKVRRVHGPASNVSPGFRDPATTRPFEQGSFRKNGGIGIKRCGMRVAAESTEISSSNGSSHTCPDRRITQSGCKGCALPDHGSDQHLTSSEASSDPSLPRETHEQPLQKACQVGYKSEIADEACHALGPLTPNRNPKTVSTKRCAPGRLDPAAQNPIHSLCSSTQCRSSPHSTTQTRRGPNAKHARSAAATPGGKIPEFLIEIHPEPNRHNHQKRCNQCSHVSKRLLTG